jgi:hypothetical protein
MSGPVDAVLATHALNATQHIAAAQSTRLPRDHTLFARALGALLQLLLPPNYTPLTLKLPHTDTQTSPQSPSIAHYTTHHAAHHVVRHECLCR